MRSRSSSRPTRQRGQLRIVPDERLRECHYGELRNHEELVGAPFDWQPGWEYVLQTGRLEDASTLKSP